MFASEQIYRIAYAYVLPGACHGIDKILYTAVVQNPEEKS